MSATPTPRKEETPALRRQGPALRVYCSPDERGRIEANAREAGYSVSRYLRLLGVNGSVRSRADAEQIRKLARVNADQGRLGGLLKALLTNDERLDGRTGAEIQSMTKNTLKEIQHMQQRLIDCIREIENG